MALYHGIHLGNCTVRVINGVAQALVDLFCIRQTTTPGQDEMITYVPGANGGYPDGIIAMQPETTRAIPNPGNGLVTTSFVPWGRGGEANITLAEACAQGALLRCGGNSTEVDGAAYLADATGDIAIGKSCEAGVIGQVIRFQFGFYGVRP